MEDFRVVDSLEDALKVAEIRNECRDFMTRDTQEISKEKQTAWFNRHVKKNENKLFLYLVDGVEIGYGYVFKENGHYGISGGIKKDWRGMGYGEKLFKNIVLSIDSPTWLEVKSDNIPAINLYKKLGFVEKRRLSPDVIYMERDEKR